MDLLLDSLSTALRLIITGDRDVLSITATTLFISIISITTSSLIFIPLGSYIYFHKFPCKGGLITLIQTLYSLPTVFVGLMVFLVFSNEGPLGETRILFSKAAIVIGHVILISPIITGLTISALKSVPAELRDTAISMGASRIQTILAMVKEARYGISTAVILGFGRAISEIGLAIIVGGNIRYNTRTLTTAMSLETSNGNFELSMALGIILVSLSLGVNILVGLLRERY